MTSYTTITNGEIDQDSPVTQPLMTAMRDNPLAVAESDPTAPFAAFAWQIEDGAGGTDPIWAHATDGSAATITTPDFDSGWEYMLLGEGLSLDDTGYLVWQGYKATPGAWSSNIAIATVPSDPGGPYLDTIDFMIQQPMPGFSRRTHYATGYTSLNPPGASGLVGEIYHSTGTTISKLRVTLSGTATVIDAGTLYLLKRAEYGGR
ncbi:hypothetical protein [Herbaspirillum sp.]|uniref:hypothetical protein n=1 Tax=Herbaspirillum sp. TaxID=1890675 RepID=UPI002586A34C|nr:hypothetical protein [Herbaspirillum sp.]MCP3946314.1 hypothetical protein [Herbaspirillum sp.]